MQGKYWAQSITSSLTQHRFNSRRVERPFNFGPTCRARTLCSLRCFELGAQPAPRPVQAHASGDRSHSDRRGRLDDGAAVRLARPVPGDEQQVAGPHRRHKRGRAGLAERGAWVVRRARMKVESFVAEAPALRAKPSRIAEPDAPASPSARP